MMDEGRPLVSVLMTSYNREKFIGDALESVLNSTYKNLELLVVDDCSSDNTVAIAKRYALQDPRISVYINEENLGDYHNRNRAISYSKGKYIKFVDSDDIIYPQSLEIFVMSMERFSDAAVGIMSNISQDEKPYPYLMLPKEAYRYHFFKNGLFDTGPTALIFRADKIKTIGGFSGKRYIGDSEINLRLAAKWPVVKLASSLVFWRRHEGQEIVAGSNSSGYLESLLPLIREELDKPECPLDEDEKKRILIYYRKISARQILRVAFLNRQPALALNLYRRLSLNMTDLLSAILFINKKP
ncbi:MAG TPA: glycosyltransferase family 2 protein [Chitinophagaceae bacterium]|nr:glycosyltransferase family 2 protein [Chitinophagaceae bacterium]